MKPHRIAVAHNLVLNYGLTSKMKVGLCSMQSILCQRFILFGYLLFFKKNCRAFLVTIVLHV